MSACQCSCPRALPLSLSLCALAHRVWVIKGNVDPQSIKVITTLGDQVVVHAVNEGSHHAGCRQR